MVDLPELRTFARKEPSLARPTVVLRGGPDSMAKLSAHAIRTARAYVLDGMPAFGISVYAALDDIGEASVDGILAGRLSTYRLVHMTTFGDLEDAGFDPLPTFGRPHLTVLLGDLDRVTTLLDLLGPARMNPHYGVMTGRRRR